jgi:zinc/manganese transport system permease protein
VRIAGVLLVFSYLVVPAAIGALLASTVRARLAIGWMVGALVSAAGLRRRVGVGPSDGRGDRDDVRSGDRGRCRCAGDPSWSRQLSRARHRGHRDQPRRAHSSTAFLARDQPWLDVAETHGTAAADDLHDARGARGTAGSVESVARAEEELAKLKKLQDEVRWGNREMDEEKQERMRQYIAGRSEIMAGDQLTLRELRLTARERQRFALGVPLLLAGAALRLLRNDAARARVDVGAGVS